MTGKIHSIETFAAADGPGVRSAVFLQGCNMRCKFCHNPETWSFGGEKLEAQQLWNKLKRYKSYWGKDGGITVSGGEPLLQAEFVTELFSLAQSDGTNTALDTSGQPFTFEPNRFKSYKNLISKTNLVILDIKLMDENGHIRLTGHSNRNILSFAKWLSDNGVALWIRRVLVPSVTDDENDLIMLRKFIDTLSTVEKIEVLPYHTLGVFKWKKLGLDYPLEGVPTPTEQQIKRAKEILGVK